MDALGLVCESHRSTEVLTSQEMDLIRHFLPPNLNSQSPGVRQQTVSLLKKVSYLPHIVFNNYFFHEFNFLTEFDLWTDVNRSNVILIKGICSANHPFTLM